jgi:hypothetical protein
VVLVDGAHRGLVASRVVAVAACGLVEHALLVLIGLDASGFAGVHLWHVACVVLLVIHNSDGHRVLTLPEGPSEVALRISGRFICRASREQRRPGPLAASLASCLRTVGHIVSNAFVL